jgi:hypothetical protein
MNRVRSFSVSVMIDCDGLPSNGRVQPPRAHPETPSKTVRSRARSGRLERHVRRSGFCHSGCRPHVPATRTWNHTGTTGVWSGSRPSGITPSTTSLDLNHAQHTIRLPRTSHQDHGRSYHAGTTSHQDTGVRTTPAQRAIRTTGARTTPCITSTGTTEVAQRAFRKPDSPNPQS